MSMRFAPSVSLTALTALLLMGCGGPATPAPAPNPDPFTLESTALPEAQPVLFDTASPIDAVRDRFDREMETPLTPLDIPKLNPGAQPPRSPNADTIVGKNLITGEVFTQPARTEPLPFIPAPTLPPVNLSVSTSSLTPNSLHALGGNLLTASNTGGDRTPVIRFEKFFPKNNIKSPCTGAMVDSQWMVTAAHCVYKFVGVGSSLNEYASSLKAFGSFNGAQSTLGFSYATQILITSSWRDQGDWNDDVAWVKLDRHMGALTRYYGYTAGSCNFFKANTVQSHGYPAETPYDGLKVFGGSFTADFCGGEFPNDVFVNTPAIGGQSGSAVRAPSQDPKYPGILTGVLSRSDRTTTTVVTPLTAQKVLDLGNSIVSSTPKQVDLMSMHVRLPPPPTIGFTAAGLQAQRSDLNNPQRLIPGTPLKNSFTLFNGSYESFSGLVNYNVYLSSNSTITQGDTLLRSFSVNVNVGPKSAYNIVTPNFPMPSCVPFAASLGYMGVIITNVDIDTANNDSSIEEAMPVNTSPLPRC